MKFWVDLFSCFHFIVCCICVCLVFKCRNLQAILCGNAISVINQYILVSLLTPTYIICALQSFLAERKQSLGYNWHPECLRCEECGKRLNPGQHAEHKGVPYCHVPCYGALFGPQLFGHGTRVESHKSFGAQKDSPKFSNGPVLPRSHLESKIKVYNQFFEGKSGEIRSREVNGRFILEGSLRIHWGIQGVIHLKENDDQRTVVTVRKRNSYRSPSPEYDTDDDIQNISRDSSYNEISTCSDDLTRHEKIFKRFICIYRLILNFVDLILELKAVQSL